MPLKLRQKYNYGETVSRPERIILSKRICKKVRVGTMSSLTTLASASMGLLTAFRLHASIPKFNLAHLTVNERFQQERPH